MKFIKFLLFLILVSGVVIAGTGAFFFYLPYGPGTETFVDIPAGTGTAGIATRLATVGVISNKYVFEAVRATQGGVLKAGEYRFEHQATVSEVYARIAKGDVYTLELSVPEGFNLFDIAGAVQAAGLGTRDAFLTAAHNDTRLIADLNPGAASLEGYLFPDTYRFSRHTTPDQIVAAMVKRFRAVVLPLGLTSTQDVARTVIMASLVEKEVSVASERPLVAGVFENRLVQKMPLATDPTVIYAALLAGRWRGTIYRSDLDFDSPYNTYRHAGLPPGPICNPGVAAFKAAISPAKTEYLYFVADASGHSRFSTNLKDHSAAVQEYRNATRH